MARERSAGGDDRVPQRRSVGRSNVVYHAGMVVRYDKTEPSADMLWIDYGLGGLTTAALERVPDSEPDLAKLYERLAADGELMGFEATNRFYEIGTPEALAEAEEFLAGVNGPSRLGDR